MTEFKYKKRWMVMSMTDQRTDTVKGWSVCRRNQSTGEWQGVLVHGEFMVPTEEEARIAMGSMLEDEDAMLEEEYVVQRMHRSTSNVVLEATAALDGDETQYSIGWVIRRREGCAVGLGAPSDLFDHWADAESAFQAWIEEPIKLTR